MDLLAAPLCAFHWPVLDMCDALLNPRFMTVLYDFLQHSQIVSIAPASVSLVEMYFLFVRRTGWVTPVNIANLKTGTLPPALKDCKVPSAWVHETEYHSLQLCRPNLGAQLKVFLHAVKAIGIRAGFDFNLRRVQSLRFAGVSEPVQSVQFAPKELREIRHQVFAIFDKGSFATAMKSPFAPVKQAIPCDVPTVHPTEVWNRYIRSQRTKRRANS